MIDVWELIAADPAAGAALWRDLLSRDLVGSVTADLRPVDDPLLYQLHDSRRARVRVADNLWVRIIDLPAALARRAYSCPVDVVVEVTDGLLPANAGRWRLRAAGLAARPESATRLGSATRLTARGRTSRPTSRWTSGNLARLTSAAPGSPRSPRLAWSRELRPGAVGRLSTAMSWDPAPWCPRIF